jgi:hypothetical protein
VFARGHSCLLKTRVYGAWFLGKRRNGFVVNRNSSSSPLVDSVFLPTL